MTLNSLRFLVGCIALGIFFGPRFAKACGHDGFYLGAGYTQLFLYTPEQQLVAAGSSDRIHFGPSFGGHFLLGYDVCGTRWGVQFPADYATFRLNHDERVSLFGSGVEAVLHLAAWEDGLDIHMVGGGGWQYLTEGENDNSTAAFGLYAGFGPGLSWYFARESRVTAALSLDLPVRVTVFFGDRLSKNQTTVFGLPLRLGMSVGF